MNLDDILSFLNTLDERREENWRNYSEFRVCGDGSGIIELSTEPFYFEFHNLDELRKIVEEHGNNNG